VPHLYLSSNGGYGNTPAGVGYLPPVPLRRCGRCGETIVTFVLWTRPDRHHEQADHHHGPWLFRCTRCYEQQPPPPPPQGAEMGSAKHVDRAESAAGDLGATTEHKRPEPTPSRWQLVASYLRDGAFCAMPVARAAAAAAAREGRAPADSSRPSAASSTVFDHPRAVRRAAARGVRLLARALARATPPVSLKRLLDASPWLQFTSECQRF
jgi:hypothetical protein